MNRSVKVNKSDLLRKLQEGKERHATEYAAAKEGYVITLREELEQKLADLLDGKEVDLIIRNKPPENNSKGYDDAIAVFEWELSNEIELGYDEFQSYVLDNWDWKDMWSASNSHYMTASSLSPRP